MQRIKNFFQRVGAGIARLLRRIGRLIVRIFRFLWRVAVALGAIAGIMLAIYLIVRLFAILGPGGTFVLLFGLGIIFILNKI